MSDSSSSSSGIGFFGLLTIVFIVMKLMGYITWSWVWVLSPAWIGLAILLLGLGVALLCFSLAGWLRHRRLNKSK